MNFCEHPLCKKIGLAREAIDLVRGTADVELPGVREDLRQDRGLEVHTVTVLNEEGARLLHKPLGRYITCTLPALAEEDGERTAAAVISRELAGLLPPHKFRADRPILLVGLGNEAVRPDALGPAMVRHTYATRQVLTDSTLPGWSSLCTLAPSVLGLTGIDTAEIVAGVCSRVRPCAVVAADALAATDIGRLGVTVQLSDTGICPGSGLGGGSSDLNQSSLGCPVVAVGVPTVAHISALVDSVCAILADSRKNAGHPTRDLVLKKLEHQTNERLLITSNDIEELIERMARLLAAALALAIHPDCHEDNVFEFIR